MKKYVLLKDLPDANAGTIVLRDKFGIAYQYKKSAWIGGCFGNGYNTLTNGQVEQSPEWFGKLPDWMDETEKITMPEGCPVAGMCKQYTASPCDNFAPTFNPVCFREKTPTYDDVVKELNTVYYWQESDGISGVVQTKYHRPHYCHSLYHLEKNKLRIKWENIAKYVNGEWRVMFSDLGQTKYYWQRVYCLDEWKWQLTHAQNRSDGTTYFKSKEAAELAMQIMGKSDFEKMNS